MCLYIYSFFFFNDTATTEIYTLSLHDALPISKREMRLRLGKDTVADVLAAQPVTTNLLKDRKSGSAGMPRPISYAVFCLKKKKKKKKILKNNAKHVHIAVVKSLKTYQGKTYID